MKNSRWVSAAECFGRRFHSTSSYSKISVALCSTLFQPGSKKNLTGAWGSCWWDWWGGPAIMHSWGARWSYQSTRHLWVAQWWSSPYWGWYRDDSEGPLLFGIELLLIISNQFPISDHFTLLLGRSWPNPASGCTAGRRLHADRGIEVDPITQPLCQAVVFGDLHPKEKKACFYIMLLTIWISLLLLKLPNKKFKTESRLVKKWCLTHCVRIMVMVNITPLKTCSFGDLLSFKSIERKQKLELDRMLVGLLLSHPKIETTFIETDFSPHQQLPCFRIWPLQVLDQSKMCRTCCFVKACHGDFCFEFNFERFQDKKEFPAGSEGLACDRAFTSFYHWILPLKSMKSNPCLKLLAGTRRNRATAKCKAKAAAKNRAKALKATKEKSAKKAQLKRPAGANVAKPKAKTKGKQLKQDYNNVYSRCYHAKRKAGFSNEEAPLVFCDFSLPPFFSLDFCKARDAARGAAHAACRSWGAGWRFCGQLALAQLKKAAVRWQCNQPITSSGSWTLSPTDCTLTAQSKCQGMQSFSDPPFRDYQGTHILPSCRNPRGYQGATFQHHPWQDATQVKQGPSRSTRHMFSRIHTSVESHSAEWSTVPTMGIWCSHTL